MNVDTILHGDALATLQTLPDGCVQTCVTSPPYFWQRDYEVNGQIGHEDTIGAYVRVLVDVFEQVKRVLAPAGVLYLNLGDTYYSGKGRPVGSDERAPGRNFSRRLLRAVDRSGWLIPRKSLIMVPWALASAMQTHGWTLRSDIIWHRPNAQPEPTADRPPRTYEHLFMFSKSRRYYFDRSALAGAGDVWTIPAASTDEHPAAFPLALAERCVLTASRPGDVVLDPFMGSGTTALACRRHSRHYLGIELNQAYIDLAYDRIANEVQPVLWTA